MKTKINLGAITNPDTNVRKEILLPYKDIIDMKALILGELLILGGIILLSTNAFKNGALNALYKEQDVMNELGLIKERIDK